MNDFYKKNILVFPCGSEIGLEIFRSLRYSIHFNLIGGSSIGDHGEFIFDNYVGDIPFITDTNFIDELMKIVKINNIDAIYPATDAVIKVLKENENKLDCIVIASDTKTCDICYSKKATYTTFNDIVPVPKTYTPNQITEYPVFGKQNIGYGSRGTRKILNKEMLKEYLLEYPDAVVSEFLAGDEYTVDCFTDKDRKLLFWSPRERRRIMNGISVNTRPVNRTGEFEFFANKINETLPLRGAWFFQLKRNAEGQLRLLEIASRFGGSSSLCRNKGVNFAQLTLFDAFNREVGILENNYDIEMDRALECRYKISIEYGEVFMDVDDCIVIDDKINLAMIEFIYQCRNNNIKLSLITRHSGNIHDLLQTFCIQGLFHRIIHIEDKSPKSKYIDNNNAIFVDDSFSERKEVKETLGLHVFSPDMIECLITNKKRGV